MYREFSFLSWATDVPMKIIDLTKVQGVYFNLQAENTTILTAFQMMTWITNLSIIKTLCTSSYNSFIQR
jgi:hypothetical protein